MRLRDGGPWRWALLFRDWLRASPPARAEYAAVKAEAAERYRADLDVARYAEAKEPWLAAARPRAQAWAASVGWAPLG